ncbi:MAG: hypothetical protein HY698_21575 [Deltaproteobacteria bacterium]|nr:hypothetical protein [Deltaproteobacteria bacterium]
MIRVLPAALAASLVLPACGGGASTDSDRDGGHAGETDAQGLGRGDGGSGPGSPDGAPSCPNPPPKVCDFFLGCGCKEGEKCTATADGPRCAPAGTKTLGDECAQDNECPAGSLCAPSGGVKQCLAFCDRDHPCAGQSQACFIEIWDGNGAFLGRACGQTCTLLAQDCPYDTQACYPINGNANQPEKGVCAKAGTGGSGDACTTSNDCKKGFLCTRRPGGTDQDKKCANMCDRSDGDPGCESGFSCGLLGGHTVTGACLPQ